MILRIVWLKESATNTLVAPLAATAPGYWKRALLAVPSALPTVPANPASVEIVYCWPYANGTQAQAPANHNARCPATLRRSCFRALLLSMMSVAPFPFLCGANLESEA